jgi:hypothetical protein
MIPPIPHNLYPVDDNTTLHFLRPYTEKSDWPYQEPYEIRIQFLIYGGFRQYSYF